MHIISFNPVFLSGELFGFHVSRLSLGKALIILSLVVPFFLQVL